MVKGAGFAVIDLGINVPREKFVEAVARFKPDVLGLSALRTTTMVEMGHVIAAPDAVEGVSLAQRLTLEHLVGWQRRRHVSRATDATGFQPAAMRN